MRQKSCGAVVYHEGKILMIKSVGDGYWGLPKGHVEPGETEEETAIREVLEETGVHIKLDSGFSFIVTYTLPGGDEKDCVYFGAETDSAETKRQVEEVSEIEWMEIDAALKSVNYDDYRRVIGAYSKYRSDNGM